MKKLFTLFIAVLTVFTLFADEGPVGRSAQDDATGTLIPGSIEQWYIRAKNRSGGTLAAGSFVVFDTANDDGYSVTTSTTAGAVPACMFVESCDDDKVCKCQTYGFTDVALFDSDNGVATAGNQAFISENNAGYIQSEVLGSIAASDVPVGIFYDSPQTSASVELFLKMR